MNIFKKITSLGEDKVIHFLVSLLLAEFFTRLIYSVVTHEHWIAYAFSAFMAWVITFAIGWWKEQYDKTHGGTPDAKDMTADAIGAFVGAGYAVVMMVIL